LYESLLLEETPANGSQLIALVVAMEVHVPPVRPGQTYSQGFWHAVIAACLYMIGSMILMVNMLGYFLGHYPQHFELDDDQRTLILQTMMFFFWLAGGAAVFSKVCGFSYADALYFCDATILTVGFGDFVANNTAGRGLVFPYSIFGIIFLGLMIKSIRSFAIGMSRDNIIRKHQVKTRERALSRSVSNETELRDRLGLPPRRDSEDVPSYRLNPASPDFLARRSSLAQYGDFNVSGRKITFRENRTKPQLGRTATNRSTEAQTASSETKEQRDPKKRSLTRRARRRERLLLLKEEKDRFDAMREIQASTRKFKQYYALSMSVLAFGILWCVGALIFMLAERRSQNLSYFETLYFCYVSLLTIGYGDFSPRSNAGKPFFVVWSLIAVPTMTILISDMGETVVLAINHGTYTLADWTVMPKKGVVHDFLEKHPRLKSWLERKNDEREAKKRIEQGFTIQNPDEPTPQDNPAAPNQPSTLAHLAAEPLTEHDLARKLAAAIKTTAADMQLPHSKRYTYEEWVEFTRLIRFSSETPREVLRDERDEGLVRWDWIGDDSPMLADVSESEWILDRLCESLHRYTRNQARKPQARRRERGGGEVVSRSGEVEGE
jgi:potassium channel subfamily K